MARERLIKWTLDGSTLKMARYFGKDAKAEDIIIEAEFDLKELVKVMFGVEWDELTDQGKQAFVYLVKQKLMDTGADAVGDVEGKVSGAKKRYAELKDGKWTGERVNATGAAENKRQLNAMKEQAKVVSLEGLMMKRAMSKLPGNPAFTEEDEKKYQELLAVAFRAQQEANQ